MSSTEGPNAATTGSMRSTKPQAQAVPALQTSEILAVNKVPAGFFSRKYFTPRYWDLL